MTMILYNDSHVQDAQDLELIDLLRAFEPVVSSRIPGPAEVLAKIRELQWSISILKMRPLGRV